MTYGRIISLAAAALLGCARSVAIDGEAESDELNADDTVTATDAGDTEPVSMEYAQWPLSDGTFRFRVDEKSGVTAEEIVYEPTDEVEDYSVTFSYNLEFVAISGPAPYEPYEWLESSPGALLADSDEEHNEYLLSDFLLGATFAVSGRNGETIRAELVFFGSGMPVICAFRGLLMDE